MGGSSTIRNSEQKVSTLRVQTSAYGLPIPIVYGTNRITANMFWYDDFQAIATTTTQSAGGKGGDVQTQNTTYTYKASFMLGLCEGIVSKVGKIWKGKDLIDADGTDQPIDQLDLYFFDGSQTGAWFHLTFDHVAQALTYPTLGFVAAADYNLGSSPSLENHNFEVTAISTVSPTIIDANPAAVFYDILTNPRYGAGYPASKIGDLTEFENYCLSTGLLISPAITERRAAHEIINELVASVNCAIVPSDGLLKVIPYGDSTELGNGATYTPDLTPLYHLTDDDYLDDDEPIRVRRKRDADAFNRVQIEYVDRANQYNAAVAEAKDQASIEQFGLRSEDAKKMPWFCTATAAARAAQLRLQRILHVRNEYEFELGWQYCLLEPMDIVTLTDTGLGLDQYPVRIKSIEEDENGQLSIVAEELLVGIGSTIDYATQANGGYQGQNDEPSNVYAPVLFEPPLDLTEGRNELWCAVAGGEHWGGCEVWVSLDDASYQQVGTIYGAARYGTLTAALSDTDTSCTVQLNTTAQLISASSAVVADTYQTLCMVGDEYFAYEDATLVTGGAYLLDGLRRQQPANHIAGTEFVRIDRAIFKYSLDRAELVGKTVYLKFLSFNEIGSRLEQLADVTAYSRVITGGAPASVAGLSLQSPWVGTTFVVQWAMTVGATLYDVQIKTGSTLKRTFTTTSSSFMYGLEQAVADGVSRTYTVRVASLVNGISSAYDELNISNAVPPEPTGITTSAASTSVTVTWDPVDVPDLLDYQVWVEASSAFDPTIIAPVYTGTALTCTVTGLSPSTTYYIRVAARDVWGGNAWDYSAEYSQATTA